MKKHLFRCWLLIALVFSLSSHANSVHAAGVLYVKTNGTGDCSSWWSACSLQTALTNAVSGDEVWVAAGVYKPTAVATERSATFQLKAGAVLYGGFAGMEIERNRRDPAVNLTILSGDIDNNDIQTPIITDLSTETGNIANSYHVVSGAADYPSATLDGFTITAGNSNGAVDPNDRGGGMYNQNTSPVLTNVTFSGNAATYAGGGMFNQYSDAPTLTGVTFKGNSAFYGGGMYNEASNPALNNDTFSGNSATYGGGIYNGNYAGLIFRNATFSGNSATYGGGVYSNSSNGITSELYSVTFSGNSASIYGGGLYNQSSLGIRNAIFWGNTAPSGGAQVYNVPNWGSYLDYSVVQDGCPAGSKFGTCENLITDDPNLGTLGNYGGFTQTIPLLAGSSAIDMAYEWICPATDQRGVPRPQGAACDMGAYELDITAPSVASITRLDPNPTYLASVDFEVTFSEPVTGVDLSDFNLTTTGVSGASVSSISGSGDTYTVTVNTGSNKGTIRLDLVNDDTIMDLASNALVGDYTSGETYQVRFYWNYLPLIVR